MPLSEPGPLPGNLPDPHAIPVTLEPVSGFHRVAIRGQNKFTPRECADQYEQCGLRQMKICQELIDRAELVAWLDENAGFRVARLDQRFCASAASTMFQSGFFRSILKSAHNGRSDSEDGPGVAPGVADRGGCLL